MPHTDSPFCQCRPCRRHPERAARALREQKIRCDHEAHKQRWEARMREPINASSFSPEALAKGFAAAAVAGAWFEAWQLASLRAQGVL